MVTIERLTRAMLKETLGELCAVEKSAVDNSGGTYRNPWTEREFSEDLPGKWTYSRIMRDDGRTVGFLVMSDKVAPAGLHYIHAHRAAVLKDVRHPTLLLDTYQDVFREARANGITWFVTKQQSYHPAMLLWYTRILSCTVLREARRIEEFTGPLPPTVAVRSDGLIVPASGPGGEGQYYIAREL